MTAAQCLQRWEDKSSSIALTLQIKQRTSLKQAWTLQMSKLLVNSTMAFDFKRTCRASVLLAGNALPLLLSRRWSYIQQVRLAKDDQPVTELSCIGTRGTWTSVKRSVMLKDIKPNPYFSETVPTLPLTAWRHIQKESRPMHYDLCCTVNMKEPNMSCFFGLLGYQMLTKPEQELPCSDGYLPDIIFMRFWRLYQLNLGLKWLEYHCILFIWHLMQHLNIFVCQNKDSGFA